MGSRTRRVNSWQEPLDNVAKAKAFLEKFGVHTAYPDDYLDRLPDGDANDWDDLLKRMT